jgi:hypothetical protein
MDFTSPCWRGLDHLIRLPDVGRPVPSRHSRVVAARLNELIAPGFGTLQARGRKQGKIPVCFCNTRPKTIDQRPEKPSF